MCLPKPFRFIHEYVFQKILFFRVWIVIMKSLFRFHKNISTKNSNTATRWTVDWLVDFYGRIKFIPNWLQFTIHSECNAFVHKLEWSTIRICEHDLSYRLSSLVAHCQKIIQYVPFTNGTYISFIGFGIILVSIRK